MLQTIYLSRYKTKIVSTKNSPTTISVHDSPEEMSAKLNALMKGLGGSTNVGKQ